MIKDVRYRNAFIYSLHVGTYMDSNGDGIGDFEGLSRRLDDLPRARACASASVTSCCANSATSCNGAAATPSSWRKRTSSRGSTRSTSAPEGDRLQMLFNFWVNQQTREHPDTAHWGQFLRNHDELDLERLTDTNEPPRRQRGGTFARWRGSHILRVLLFEVTRSC